MRPARRRRGHALVAGIGQDNRGVVVAAWRVDILCWRLSGDITIVKSYGPGPGCQAHYLVPQLALRAELDGHLNSTDGTRERDIERSSSSSLGRCSCSSLDIVFPSISTCKAAELPGKWGHRFIPISERHFAAADSRSPQGARCCAQAKHLSPGLQAASSHPTGCGTPRERGQPGGVERQEIDSGGRQETDAMKERVTVPA